MKTKIVILLAFFALHMAAQDRKALTGIVTAGDARVPGVFVINRTAGTETRADARGNFTIQAKNGDRITVHSVFTEDRDFYISTDSFKKMPYVLAVETKATELEEVIVNDTLSIIQPVIGTKEYTAAERRVNAGGTTGVRYMEVTRETGGGVAIPLDAVFNGKKAKGLKRELDTERLEKITERIKAIYTKDEMTEVLGIPAEKTDAFTYYAAEDAVLVKAFSENNTDQARLQLSVLSQQYLSLQEETPPPAETKD
jgi:hypothetical protein